MLRLLYLSDIHFREPECLNPRTDLASNDRKLLINDLKDIIRETGKRVDAIVVTGDISFKAHKSEFDTATNWLKELADINRIDESKIFVVPGNHDVDRSVADDYLLTSFREMLNGMPEPQKKLHFTRSLQNEDTKNLILRTMQNYNQFAKQYGCEIELPDKPFWTHYLSINDKYKLCLNGLTTTFISSSSDDTNKLYLGESQAYLDAKDGIINLAMFHHPKDWLSDGDKFEDLLAENAQIWLSGHKHRQRYITDDRYLDLPSAAVSPSEFEPGLSGYNIIDISVKEFEGHAELELSVMMRMLQESPKQYIAKKTHKKEDILIHSIKIPKSEHPISNDSNECLSSDIKIDVFEEMSNKASEFKNLVNRIWDLQMSKRISIFKALGLGVDSYTLTNEEAFVREMLEKIKNDNLLERLELLIIEQEKN